MRTEGARPVRKLLSALVSTLALTSIVGAAFVPAANANPTAGYAAETGPAETVGIAGAPTLGQWVSQRVVRIRCLFQRGNIALLDTVDGHFARSLEICPRRHRRASRCERARVCP
jgi:hypothetical protein